MPHDFTSLDEGAFLELARRSPALRRSLAEYSEGDARAIERLRYEHPAEYAAICLLLFGQPPAEGSR